MSDNVIIIADRIKEKSYSTGAGNFELFGAIAGFSSFNSVYSYGDSLFYAITDGSNYEIGSGIFQSGITYNEIVRFPFRSSNNNSIVSFPAGQKEVYVTYPATHAVYIGSGISDYNFPKESGLAFWSSSNILNYDGDIVWDRNQKRLGIRTNNPLTGLHVGGNIHEAQITASGYHVGQSGLIFPAANNGNIDYAGGAQLQHFESNQLDQYAVDNNLIGELTGTSSVFELSGVVNQFILFQKQNAGSFFAGPPSGCVAPCNPSYPYFRSIVLDDVPFVTEASGALQSDINTVSGVFRNDLLVASGSLQFDIDTVSGVFRNDLTVASGALQFDIDTISGVFRNDLTVASGSLRSDLWFVSGEMIDNAISQTSNIFNVTNIPNAYVVSGVGLNAEENPSMILHKGLTYKFDINAIGHPFWIKSSPSTGSSNAWADGIENNGIDSGILKFTVPQDAPLNLYYNCQYHASMSGNILTQDIHNFTPSHRDDVGLNISSNYGQFTFDDDFIYVKTSLGWAKSALTLLPTTTTTTTTAAP